MKIKRSAPAVRKKRVGKKIPKQTPKELGMQIREDCKTMTKTEVAKKHGITIAKANYWGKGIPSPGRKRTGGGKGKLAKIASEIDELEAKLTNLEKIKSLIKDKKEQLKQLLTEED